MKINLKLTGELRHVFNQGELTLDFNENEGPVSLRLVLARLIERDSVGKNAPRIILSSKDVNLENVTMKDLNPAIIIFINDVDYRITDGLDSELKNDDTVVLIPSIHGG